MRSPLTCLAVGLAAAVLAACSGGDPTDQPTTRDSQQAEGPAPVRGDGCRGRGDLQTGVTRHTFDVGGTTREMQLVVPSSYDGTTPLPLVVFFHGLGATAQDAVLATHLTTSAEQRGIVVAVPQGLGATPGWDFETSAADPTSDRALAYGVVRLLQDQACIDDDRTYAGGFSNGSLLTLALACDDRDTFAAFAGGSAPYFTERCEGAPRRSLFYLHGKRDMVVPYDGGRTPVGEVRPAGDVVADWVRHDDCPAGSSDALGSGVTRFTWTGCADGTAIRTYAADDLTHAWPIGQPLDATDLMLDFFADHPRVGP